MTTGFRHDDLSLVQMTVEQDNCVASLKHIDNWFLTLIQLLWLTISGQRPETSIPVPNKPSGFCGRKASLKKKKKHDAAIKYMYDEHMYNT